MKKTSKDSRSSKEKHRGSKSRSSKSTKSRHLKSSVTPPKDIYKEKTASDTPLAEKVAELPKSFHSLKEFVSNKEELLDQIFLSIRKQKLQEIMPKILKKYTVEELKKMCLAQLKEMSEKEILHIISGNKTEYNKSKEGSEVQKKVVCDSSTSGETADNRDLSSKRKAEESSSKDYENSSKRVAVCQADSTVPTYNPSTHETISNDALELYPSSKELESLQQEEPQNIPKADVKPITELKEISNDLELLELEMRARAIRSLLRARGLPSSSEDENEEEKHQHY